MPDPVPYRLPRTIVPRRYELTLTPDLGAARFAGEAHIHVDVTETVTEVVLNAVELDILTAELISSTGERLPAQVTYDEPEERAIIALSAPAQPGPWELDLTFTGLLNDKLHGFYRSTFRDADGAEQVIATTQFEATDARRAFPCWDEPDFKATFAVTLIVDQRPDRHLQRRRGRGPGPGQRQAPGDLRRDHADVDLPGGVRRRPLRDD